jgi:hypothetical protein
MQHNVWKSYEHCYGESVSVIKLYIVLLLLECNCHWTVFTDCPTKHDYSFLKHWCFKCWTYVGIICYRRREPARWFCPAAGEPHTASPAAAILFCSAVWTHSCADSWTVGCTVQFLQRCSACYRCNRRTFSGMTSHTHTHTHSLFVWCQCSVKSFSGGLKSRVLTLLVASKI